MGGSGSHGQDGGNGWNGLDGSEDAQPKLSKEQFKNNFPKLCRRLISQRIDARQSLLMKLNETLPQVDRKENSFDVSSATSSCVPFQIPASSFNIEGPKYYRLLFNLYIKSILYFIKNYY